MNMNTNTQAQQYFFDRRKKMSLVEATEVFWSIQKQWNKSRTQPVTLTVETALNGLHAILSSQEGTQLADRALKLSEDIISLQIDTLPAKDS